MGRSHFFALLILCLSAGCGDDTLPRTAAPSPVITVEEWMQLPVQEKYDEATFERLRAGDPKLQTERGWDGFMREVVIPERKKDIPGVPGQ